MDIDVNEIGRNGYKLLLANGVVDCDIDKLTPKKREELCAKLESTLADILYKKVTEKSNKEYSNIHKYNFLSVLYSSIIAYLDNTNLNKFINLKAKNY